MMMRRIVLALLVTAGTGVVATQSWVRAASDQAPDLETGKALYTEQCLMCHGTHGKGDGPAGRYMDPPPRDLSDADYMKTRTDTQLIATVTDGKEAMPPFKDILSATDIKVVVAYLRTLSGT